MSELKFALFHGHTLFSHLIEWQTRGAYSHVAILLPDGRQLESFPGVGVIARPQFDSHGCMVDFFSVHVDEQALEKATAWALSEIGCKYDWYGDFCFVTRMHTTASGKRWFCSEYAYAYAQRAGLQLLRDTWAWEVSPVLLGRSPLLTPCTRSP